MEDESVEDRSVEVLQIPASLEDDLLWLYFENKRRSGGGNLISLERTGDKAVLVFENADAAVRVVEKGSHTLSNATLIVRKKPWKDVGKLLLRGLSLTTSHDMLELYVENLTGIESDHYTLYPSPGKDLVLVHLHQPAAEDFDKMQSKVSKRSLDGARVTLEQVECTDSIVVENLHPDLTEDLLALYFESSRSGGGEVTAVSRISSQLAKVSFKDVQTVDSVLQKPHRLEETDLIVKPYYSFLHPEEGASQETLRNGTPQSEDDPMGPVSPLNVLHADRTSTGSSVTPSQQAVTMNPDLQITSEPLNTSITTSQVLQAPLKQQPCVCHVSIPDPSKRELVSLCDVPEQLKQSHPDYKIAVMQNGVKVEAPSQDEAEKLKSKVLEFLSGVASPEEDSVSMVTLKDLEQEVKQNIVRFLSTPIQKEIVLSMQPAMLTYIQLHHQQLLMDMAEVVILPLDTEDGLSIQGNPTACQTAAEVLSSVVSSTYTKIITVNQPGIARFLLQDPEGISILGEMTAKFQDIFAVAWKMMSSQSFVRSSSSEGLRDLKASASSENDKDFSARLEEAKMILLMESDGSRTAAEEMKVEEKETEEEDMDLYTDTLSSGEQEDLMSLDEDAYLSLAIQMSMESSQNQDRRAEEEFQQVLQLSREEAASADESLMLVKAVDESLQEAISSANRAQIEVFACYTHDLVRVDIALGKKVGLRQCEEKLQHKSFRKLSAFHRRCLDLIRRKHAVDIQIQGTTAIVSGFRDYVAGAMPDLNALQESASGVTSDAEILKTVHLLADVPDAVRLEEHSEEYKEVSTEFFNSLSDKNQAHIIKVEKLMNRLLYSQYRLKKADMEQKVRGEVERTLYHGTSESSVKEICIHGFNRSFCGKNATAFGQGVYFAVKSSYSFSDTYSPPNADGHKFIFVARVLTGDFTQGKHDMRAAPLRQSADVPVRYHSAVDSVKEPSLFVIFNDTQAYPQYLITCMKV
ncbi:poly [ADP-ribose] polymerase 10, partial [Silurus asotus]